MLNSDTTLDQLLYICRIEHSRRNVNPSSIRLYDIKKVKGKGSPYSISERRVPELIPVLGSQPASDTSHTPDGRLPLLSARPTVTLATLKRAAIPILLLGEQMHNGCEQFA